MKHSTAACLAFVFVTNFVFAVAGAATAPTALVIGNANYAALPPLPACAASARIVAAALRRAGFATTEKADVSNGEMGSALADLAATAGAAPQEGTVLYICGYVTDYQNRAFLLPASANLQRDTDALTQGLTASSAIGALARSGTQAGLVLLDTVDMPNAPGTRHFDALAAIAGPHVGLAVTAAITPPPEGATRLAAALATALTGAEPEAGALLHAISARLGPGDDLTLAIPPGTLPLRPGPAASLAAPSAAPSARSATPAAAFPDEMDMTETDRRTIQYALLRLGYYDKQVDGVFGADTRAAIRRFQHEIGADMTGIISPAQSARLLSGSH